ncbi:MAG: dephospho-CoA kinase [Bacteroidales bacterium]|nr:dephospho-CoA kinase [Bacteroidales bacterium]
MISIGLTGHIGSGKSSVAKIFESFGFEIFDADILAKNLYEIPEIQKNVEQILGIPIRDSKGKIAYKAMAEIYFNNESLYHRLNSVLYPALTNYTKHLIQESKNNILIEAAMFFEIGLQDLFTYKIHVSAKQEIRHDRLQKSRNMSVELIKEREKMQGSERIKEKRSDFVIQNNEEDFLIVKVENILKEIGYLPK